MLNEVLFVEVITTLEVAAQCRKLIYDTGTEKACRLSVIWKPKDWEMGGTIRKQSKKNITVDFATRPERREIHIKMVRLCVKPYSNVRKLSKKPQCVNLNPLMGSAHLIGIAYQYHA